MGETFIIILVVTFAATLSWALSHHAVKKRIKGLRIGIWTLWGGRTLLLVAAMMQATGWDGIGYFILLLFGSAPSAVGLVGGEISGRYKRT